MIGRLLSILCRDAFDIVRLREGSLLAHPKVTAGHIDGATLACTFLHDSMELGSGVLVVLRHGLGGREGRLGKGFAGDKTSVDAPKKLATSHTLYFAHLGVPFNCATSPYHTGQIIRTSPPPPLP